MSAACLAAIIASVIAGGTIEPAESQARGEDLARRARVHDAVRAEALDRADRLAVVAELGVVVVLDDHGAAPRRPVGEARAAVRAAGRRRSGTGGRP